MSRPEPTAHSPRAPGRPRRGQGTCEREWSTTCRARRRPPPLRGACAPVRRGVERAQGDRCRGGIAERAEALDPNGTPGIFTATRAPPKSNTRSPPVRARTRRRCESILFLAFSMRLREPPPHPRPASRLRCRAAFSGCTLQPLRGAFRRARAVSKGRAHKPLRSGSRRATGRCGPRDRGTPWIFGRQRHRLPT